MNFIKKNLIFSIVAAITLIASAYLIYMDLDIHSTIAKANAQKLAVLRKGIPDTLPVTTHQRRRPSNRPASSLTPSHVQARASRQMGPNGLPAMMAFYRSSRSGRRYAIVLSSSETRDFRGSKE